MKIALFGNGKMGQLIAKLAEEQGSSIIGVFSKKNSPSLSLLQECDVCIDFSHPEVVFSHLKLALLAKKPIVIGTTGWDNEIARAKDLVGEQGTAVFSPNFSLGMALFTQLLMQAASLFSTETGYDAAGIEYHHSQKKDSPSGTAKLITTLLGGNLSFSSIRCGNLPGTHTIIFDSAVDTITLSHEARNREGFAFGALKAAEWIQNKKGWWSFDGLVRSLYTPHHSV